MSRSVRKSDEDIPVPPLVKSAVLWGMRINVKHDSVVKSLPYVELATMSCCITCVINLAFGFFSSQCSKIITWSLISLLFDLFLLSLYANEPSHAFNANVTPLGQYI